MPREVVEYAAIVDTQDGTPYEVPRVYRAMCVEHRKITDRRRCLILEIDMSMLRARFPALREIGPKEVFCNA